VSDGSKAEPELAARVNKILSRNALFVRVQLIESCAHDNERWFDCLQISQNLLHLVTLAFMSLWAAKGRAVA
jgi:hypothetical protein